MSTKGKRHVQDLIRRFDPTIFIVLKTHIVFSAVVNFWERLGFEAVGIIKANRHSGGNWMMARKDKFQVQVVDIYHQCVTVRVSSRDKWWLCSATYRSPTLSSRSLLWDY